MLEGIIKKKLSNGFVFIMSDEQEEFIVHEREMSFKAKEGRRVSFERGVNPAEDGKYPWAINIQRLESDVNKQSTPGEWIMNICSHCGISKYNFFTVVSDNSRPFGTWKYCPNCGTKMKDGE